SRAAVAARVTPLCTIGGCVTARQRAQYQGHGREVQNRGESKHHTPSLLHFANDAVDGDRSVYHPADIRCDLRAYETARHLRARIRFLAHRVARQSLADHDRLAIEALTRKID